MDFRKSKSVFSLQVRESVKMFANVQKRLEYSHSLQDTICSNYRKMTEQEVTLKEKVCMDKSDNEAIINNIILYNSDFCITIEHYCCNV